MIISTIANLLLPLCSALVLAATITKSEAYYTTEKATYPGENPGKLTHLHFYFHDTVSGNNPSSVVIVKGSNSSTTAFGMVAIADDPLTVGPLITTEEIGRGQGMFASADQKNFGFLMNFNFVFTKGEFAGSSIAMYGRNPILSVVREMSIIGGTGAFRFARGYAEARTFTANFANGDAVVEYNVYIWH